jgi:serine/threonine-protein kinase
MSETRLGKYELRGILGRGAMGIVYDGWDPLIDRRVAIKTVRVLDGDDDEMREALARFKREAQAAGRLTHPNIVGVYDYGESDELAYIVMEFAAGNSLKSVLDERHRLPPAEAVAILEQVLAGLAYSHARGVVHRDIKPGNIIITGGGQVKIADFGIARVESSSMTSVGTIMGTPAYMPPEQFRGEPVDARSDLYAAGVMAFQLLGGQRPYEGSMTTIMQKVLNTPVPPLVSGCGGVPPAFDPVVARAMARAPEDRFASAEAFASALRAALAAPLAALADVSDATVVLGAGQRNAAPPPTTPVPPLATAGRASAQEPAALPPPRNGKRLALLAGLGVLVLLSAGAAYFALRGGQAPPAGLAPEAARPNTPPVSAPAIPKLAANPVPERTPPAPPDPAAVGKAVLAAAAMQGCSFLTVTSNAAGVQVVGLVGGTEQGAARAAIAAAAGGLTVSWQPRALDQFWCATLDALRPYGAAGQLQVGLETGERVLRDGELIKPDVSAPSFAHYLQVDDFARGGETARGRHVGPTVAHFYPTPKQRARRRDANVAMHIRDQAWCVSEPYGADLLVAAATTGPLFAGVRPAEEPMDVYLAAMKAALDKARARGDQISVGIGVLDTAAGKGREC